MSPRVLLLARHDDLHADSVADGCRRRGLAFLRFAPVQLAEPSALTFTIEPYRGSWAIHSPRAKISVNDDYRVYCRDFGIDPVSSAEDLGRSVAIEETTAFLRAWATMLPSERCVDHPFLQHRFDNKLAQIPFALKAGLSVPRTVAGNDPAAVGSLVKSAPSVAKLLSHVSFTGMEGQGEFIYTTPINASHEAYLQDVRCCPVLIQELVEKVADVRVMVVGSRLFPAVIWPEDSAAKQIDFRARQNAEARKFEIDPVVEASIRRFMQLLGVRFAAIDFGLTREGELVFFEANLTGNWLWIEQEAGLPITDAIVEELSA